MRSSSWPFSLQLGTGFMPMNETLQGYVTLTCTVPPATRLLWAPAHVVPLYAVPLMLYENERLVFASPGAAFSKAVTVVAHGSLVSPRLSERSCAPLVVPPVSSR